MDTTSHPAFWMTCASRKTRRALFAAFAADHANEFRSGMHAGGVEHALAKNQLLVMPDADTSLLCLEGELWLTRDGDIEDYILGPGKSFIARRGDKVAVMALRPSRLRLAAA